MMKKLENWVLCPICEKKPELKCDLTLILENFPLFCPKCKKETLINVKELNITIIKEPDAKTAEIKIVRHKNSGHSAKETISIHMSTVIIGYLLARSTGETVTTNSAKCV